MAHNQTLGNFSSYAKILKLRIPEESTVDQQANIEYQRIINVLEHPHEFDNICFKGIKFVNTSIEVAILNLCYINAIVNGLLNFKCMIHLIKITENCDVIDKFKHWIINKDDTNCTESLRDLVIRKGYVQFSNKVQSDPDEFMCSLLQISNPLKTLFTFDVLKQVKCDKCNDISCHIEPFSSLNVVINDKSISKILEKNRVSNVTSLCNVCKVDCKKTVTEIFCSFP